MFNKEFHYICISHQEIHRRNFFRFTLLGHKFRSQLCFYFPGILSLQVCFLWSAEVRGCCMVTGRGAHLYLQHWPYNQLLHKPLL